MSNIPPLLSSSPPPLDITDDGEDFVEEITAEQYEYDEISEQGFNSNKQNKNEFHFNDTGLQILDDDLNALSNVNKMENCVPIDVKDDCNEPITKIPNDCENNNDKVDPEDMQITATTESDIKLELLDFHICNNPSVNEIAELIDPLSLNGDVEKSSLCSAIKEHDSSILLSPKEHELDTNAEEDVKSNYESSKLSKNELCEHEEILSSCQTQEETSEDIVFNNMESSQISDDFDDFDDFISAPGPILEKIPSDISSEIKSVERVEYVANSVVQEVERNIYANGYQEDDSDVLNEISSNQTRNNEDKQDDRNHVELDNSSKHTELLYCSELDESAKTMEINAVEQNSTNITDCNNSADNDFEEDNDFGDFSSFETNTWAPIAITTPVVLNFYNETMNLNTSKDALIDKLQSVVTMMFPIELKDQEVIENTSSELMKVLQPLKDMEITNATTFQWRNSKTYGTSLKALGIDSRNIMFGPRWSNGVPRFASNLSCGPLEPLKPTPIADALPAATRISPQNENIEVPAAKFDWASAGLVNPLDAKTIQPGILDLSSLGHLISSSEPETNPKNPLSELNFIYYSTDKSQGSLEKDKNEVKLVEELKHEQSLSQVDLPSIDFDIQSPNSNNFDNHNSNDSGIQHNIITGHSFNLPETHIYTSPIAISQVETNIQQERNGVLEVDPTKQCFPSEDIYQAASNSCADKLSDTVIFNKSSSADHAKVSDIHLKPSCDVQTFVYNGNTPFDNTDFPQKPNVNSQSTIVESDLYNLPHIPVNKIRENTLDTVNYISSLNNNLISSVISPNDSLSDMPLPKINPESTQTQKIAAGIYENKTVDLDTSFNDFQSYDGNQGSTSSLQISNISPKIKAKQKYFPPVQMLTPTILQPTANSFTPSIDWSCSNNQSKKSIDNSTCFDDSQTEWSDFVSITTVAQNNSLSSINDKSNINVNAFKVPIQIDPTTIKKPPNSVQETEADDWSDFISSGPVIPNPNDMYKKVDDKWNRTSPQFNNWQSDRFHTSHMNPNYSRTTNMNIVSNYAYNQQSMLDEYKSSMKFHKVNTNNTQYKQAEDKKQKAPTGQNSIHKEISSISSVPELGFVVPQSLLYLSNLPKK